MQDEKTKTPFADLPMICNETPLSQEIINEWVIPFYMKDLDEQQMKFAAACVKATPELTLQLLREYNWRPRTVAAHIIAVQRNFEMQEEMSNIFLQNKLCYVGREYCLTLTRFANSAATDTLCRHLDYYLRTDLGADKAMAMSALLYLDEKQGTNHCHQFGSLFKALYGEKTDKTLKWCCRWIHNATKHIEEIERLMKVT